jgi:mRNA interferase HigB
LRVISKKRLREHWSTPGRRDSEQPLKTWFDVVRKARWSSHSDVKTDLGANVDLAHGKYVFDIKGNAYRLVCLIDFVRHGVLVLWIGTHAEYDELNRRGGERLKRL